MATQAIGVQQNGDIRAIDQRANGDTGGYIHAEKLLQKRVGGNIDYTAWNSCAAWYTYHTIGKITNNTRAPVHLWLRSIGTSQDRLRLTVGEVLREDL